MCHYRIDPVPDKLLLSWKAGLTCGNNTEESNIKVTTFDLDAASSKDEEITLDVYTVGCVKDTSFLDDTGRVESPME